MYCNFNNLYGKEVIQKLPVDSFKWKNKSSEFNQEFIQSYDVDNNKRYILDVDVS